MKVKTKLISRVTSYYIESLFGPPICSKPRWMPIGTLQDSLEKAEKKAKKMEHTSRIVRNTITRHIIELAPKKKGERK